tara:strand:+ start:371 stop:487 length:117 start_codon:yes stop_codon:yes gene_type:complete
MIYVRTIKPSSSFKVQFYILPQKQQNNKTTKQQNTLKN